MCYDWLLTLDDEVHLVWMAPKPLAAWLFLFNRYFAIVTVKSQVYVYILDMMN